MDKLISDLAQKVLSGESISFEEALSLEPVQGADLYILLAYASKIREHFQGDKVDLCSIISAKTGNCSEDCKFCAQSAHHKTKINKHNMLEVDEIVQQAKKMEAAGAHHFDIVISGLGVHEHDPDFLKILEAFRIIKQETKLELCACLGTLTPKTAQMLVDAGVKRYNHNLEAAPSFFSEVVSTHTIDERIETLKIVKDAGMELCCGGIIGMGETFEQRVELAFKLKELGVHAVPLNILNPIPGTRFETLDPMTPQEILKTFAIFRFILPDRNIRFAGGREVNLGELQPLGFLAGLNGMLIGNYLTTTGRNVEDDLKMIKSVGLSY